MLNSGIIKKALSTWKSEQQRKNSNVYTFYVDPSQSKFRLREVLEKTFDVKIERISSLREKAVPRNRRRNTWTKPRKKIFVKLRDGYKIGRDHSSEELGIDTSSSATNDPKQEH